MDNNKKSFPLWTKSNLLGATTGAQHTPLLIASLLTLSCALICCGLVLPWLHVEEKDVGNSYWYFHKHCEKVEGTMEVCANYVENIFPLPNSTVTSTIDGELSWRAEDDYSDFMNSNSVAEGFGVMALIFNVVTLVLAVQQICEFKVPVSPTLMPKMLAGMMLLTWLWSVVSWAHYVRIMNVMIHRWQEDDSVETELGLFEDIKFFYASGWTCMSFAWWLHLAAGGFCAHWLTVSWYSPSKVTFRTMDSVEEADEAAKESEKKKEETSCWPDTTEGLQGLAIVLCKVVALIATLYVFFVGLSMLGTGMKVLTGRSAGNAFTAIDNPITGLIVGILATVLVQSSSTSTSIIVGLVGADILTVEQAIPVIMGANIGTSVTNTIVSMGQMADRGQLQLSFAGATVHDMFNFLSVLVLLPVEIATHFLAAMTRPMAEGLMPQDACNNDVQKSLNRTKCDSYNQANPIKTIVNPVVAAYIKADSKKIAKIAAGETVGGSVVSAGAFHGLGDEGAGIIGTVLSLVLLIGALVVLVKLLHSLLAGNLEKQIRKYTKVPGIVAIFIGMVATFVVQSSSIVTSALTPLVGIGLVDLEQMLPLTLGANIGTTITAIIASTVVDKNTGLQIALCHLFFNLSGMLIWYPLWFMRDVPLSLARALGFLVVRFGKIVPVLYIAIVFFAIPVVMLLASLASEVLAIALFIIIVICVLVFLSFFCVFQHKPELLPESVLLALSVQAAEVDLEDGEEEDVDAEDGSEEAGSSEFVEEEEEEST